MTLYGRTRPGKSAAAFADIRSIKVDDTVSFFFFPYFYQFGERLSFSPPLNNTGHHVLVWVLPTWFLVIDFITPVYLSKNAIPASEEGKARPQKWHQGRMMVLLWLVVRLSG